MSFIEKTKKWIDKFVIEHNLCPFAARVMHSNSVAFRVCQSKQLEVILEDFQLFLYDIKSSHSQNSGFLIFPHWPEDFNTYLDIFDLSEKILIEMKFDGVFQLAGFHPQYQFEDTSMDDPTNFTNRSPFPMIHILSIEEVGQAILSFGDTNKIIVQNKSTLTKLGMNEIKKQLGDL